MIARFSAAFGRAGLLRNAIALTYGTGARIALQLVSVAVFTYFWGLHDYGTWLILFTIPALIAMGDVGFNIAASNAMIRAIETGDEQKAADIFRALRLTLRTVAAVAIAAALVAYAIDPGIVRFADAGGDGRAELTVAAVVGYAVFGLQNTGTLAAFRASGDFAKGVMLFESTNVVETLAALAVVALGGDLFHAAVAFLSVRAVFSMIALVVLRRHAPGLYRRRGQSARAILRELAAPAMALAAVPISHGLVLQGAVAVLGAFAGPASVPAFAVTRTLTRLPFHVMMIAVNAAMPLFTAAAARGNRAQMASLVNATLTAAIFILPVPMLVFGLFGGPIVELWTQGVVRPDALVVWLLVISGLAYGPWLLLCNFVIALNEQGRFSYAYLAAAASMLAATALAAVSLGAVGAAGAMLALDLFMLVWVYAVARKLDIVGPETWRQLVSIARLKRAFALLRGRREPPPA